MQTEQEFLENYNINDYDRPSLTTDIVLLALNRNNNNTEPEKYASVTNLQILLIERANHPEKGKWALPGGFCRPSESVYETAKRELYEETNISEAYLELTGVHSEQNRDPRGWIISNSWLGLIDKQKCNLRADTDAWDAAWFHVSNLESKITNSSMNMTEYTHTLELIHETTGELLETTVTETIILNSNGCESIYHTINMSPYFAFDHNEIIVKTLIGFREKIKNDVRPLFDLVPREFILSDIQNAYELILNTKSQNFRRKIASYVKETNKYVEIKAITACRPAQLFTKNQDMFKYRI